MRFQILPGQRPNSAWLGSGPTPRWLTNNLLLLEANPELNDIRLNIILVCQDAVEVYSIGGLDIITTFILATSRGCTPAFRRPWPVSTVIRK